MNNYAFLLRMAFCILIIANVSTCLAKVTADNYLAEYVKLAQTLPSAPLIDREIMLNKSAIKQVLLSPSGDFLIYQKEEGHQDDKLVSVWRYDIKLKTQKRLFIYQSLQYIYLSKSGDKLILNTGDSIAIAESKAASSPIVLTRFDQTKYEDWLGFAADNDHSLLMRKWQPTDKYYYVERVSFTGSRTDIFRSDVLFNGFNVDEYGQPAFLRVFNQADDNKGEHFIYQLNKDKKVLRFTCQWDDPCGVVKFDRQQEAFLLKTNANSNFTYLARLSSQGQLTVIQQDPNLYGDLNNVHWAKNQPVVTQYFGEYDQYSAIDDRLLKHTDFLNKQFSQQDFYLQLPHNISLDRQLNDGVWLISAVSNSVQEQHFLYHLKQQKLEPILLQVVKAANQGRQLIKDEYLAPRISFHYANRDGQHIQGYLTLPRGKTIANTPLVAFPHGGPWSRDDGSFDMMAQFLANRGYIVFQPNFRASTGFGKQHHSGVSGDFGYGRTHFDIIDGVNYLLKNNIGDKDKLAMAGHSFGGLSVLTALTFEPELFKVGFAGAPPSHIGRSAKYYYRYQKKKFGQSRKYFMQQLVVDWHDDKAYKALTAIQPESHIERIQAPLLLWAGKNDGRVFITDVKNYALTAQAKEKSIQLFVDPNSAHSPSSRVSFSAYLFLMEATLGHYLQQAVEPVKVMEHKALYRFLKKNLVLETETYLSHYVH